MIFPDERPVFLREVNNNMYKCSPYFWAKVISEMPFSIMMPTIFGCIVYFSVGLDPLAGRFFMFLLILILIYNASSGYSLVISCTFSDKQLAVTLTPVLIIPFMLFAGFFVAASNIPVWLREFEYLSIFKYGYQSLMHNQFDRFLNIYAEYAALNCPNTQNVALWPVGTNPECTTLYNEMFYTCLVDGTCDPLSQISQRQDLASSMGCLFALYAACYLISWGILIRLSKTYE